jgi:hypothetical protein
VSLPTRRLASRIRDRARLLRDTGLPGTAAALRDIAAEVERLGQPPGSDESGVTTLWQERDARLGVVRLERWPEGYVLWCGGEVVWRDLAWRRAKAPPHG